MGPIVHNYCILITKTKNCELTLRFTIWNKLTEMDLDHQRELKVHWSTMHCLLHQFPGEQNAARRIRIVKNRKSTALIECIIKKWFSEFIITKRLPKLHVSIGWLFTATLEKELLDAYFTNWHTRSKLKVLMCLC